MTRPERPASRRFGILCLIVTSVGWGLNWPAMKFLLEEWPPLLARGCAGVAAAMLVAAMAVIAGQSLAVPREQWRRLLASAMLNVFAWMGFSTLAMRWLRAGQGALLVYTMPVWAILLAWPLLGKKPSKPAVTGLLMCMAGIGLLFGGHDMALGAAQFPGVAFAVGAALLFAFGTVVLKPLALPPLAALAWQLLLGCVPMLLLSAAFEQPQQWNLSRAGWAVMAYMTLIPMGLCYLAWFAALRRLPPAIASTSTLLTPVVGVISAAWVLGDPLGVKELAAMALTLGGVAVALRQPR
ncbi:MAG: family transporter [Paucimonas sp.]|nr:family transporter [Paucimonas sp.]